MRKIIIIAGLGTCIIVFAFMICNSMDNPIPNPTIKPQNPSPTKSQVSKSFEGVKPQATRPRPKPKPAKPPIFREGQTFNVGYTSYCVWESFWASTEVANKFLNISPDAMFLFVELTVRNDDRKARSIPPFKLIDENGAEYETSSRASWRLNDSFDAFDSLNPSVQKRGFIVFDTPANLDYKLKVSGGYWTSEYALVKLAPKYKPD